MVDLADMREIAAAIDLGAQLLRRPEQIGPDAHNGLVDFEHRIAFLRTPLARGNEPGIHAAQREVEQCAQPQSRHERNEHQDGECITDRENPRCGKQQASAWHTTEEFDHGKTRQSAQIPYLLSLQKNPTKGSEQKRGAPKFRRSISAPNRRRNRAPIRTQQPISLDFSSESC